MWNNFNQLIIKAQQQVRIDEKKLKNIGIDLFIFFFFITAAIAKVAIRLNNHPTIDPSSCMFFLLTSMAAWGVMAFSPCNPSEFTFYFWHYLIPGKNKREIQIKEFMFSYYEKEAIVKNTFFDDERIKNFNKDTIKEWVDENVGTESSIHNLINTRVLGSRHLNMGIIYWSLLAPLAKLDVNQKRSVLQSCQIVDNEACLYELYINYDLNKVFSYYSSAEIVRLFTSPYKIEEYLEVLQMAGDYDLSFPVKKNIRELQAWIWNIKILKDERMFVFERDKPWIETMEQGFELGEVKHIDNQLEFEQWGEYMSNCLRNPKQHYHSRVRHGDSHLFGVWRYNRPYMLLELTKYGAYMEAKKRANAILSQDEMSEIFSYINKYVHKKK